eukprot:CAMPEP_0113504822 /NCGR_PEP_ID=MMETSP0014_2-20120614/34941_1 /TAXON_ID=2857 /ORGANISM="Nitzschia sp." /LENGTH=509 /DNA_ID=CAMNT_0000399999 /DNA_START=227 /DNA_END=1753 /DNA_ORIENTATION=- /assembly_acc=CAM_ASM_000159
MADPCTNFLTAAVQCAAQDFTGQCSQCVDLSNFSNDFKGSIVQKFAQGQAFAIPGTDQFCTTVNDNVCQMYTTSYSCCDAACGTEMAAYRTCIFENVAPQQLGMSSGCADSCGQESGGGGGGGGVSVALIGGVAAGVVVVVLLGIWWYLRRRRRSNLSEGESPAAETPPTRRSRLACCFGCGNKVDEESPKSKAVDDSDSDDDDDDDSDDDDEERGNQKKRTSTNKTIVDDTSSGDSGGQQRMSEAQAMQAAQQKRLQELQEQQRRLQQEQMRRSQQQQHQKGGMAQPSKASQMDSRRKSSYDSDSDSDSSESAADNRRSAPAPVLVPVPVPVPVSSSVAREKKHAIEEWQQAKRQGSKQDLKDFEEEKQRSCRGSRTFSSSSGIPAAAAVSSSHSRVDTSHSRTTAGGTKPKRISSRDLNNLIHERAESVLRVNELEDEKAEMEDHLAKVKREADALKHERELAQKRIDELEAMNRRLRSDMRRANPEDSIRSRSRSRSTGRSFDMPS